MATGTTVSDTIKQGSPHTEVNLSHIIQETDNHPTSPTSWLSPHAVAWAMLLVHGAMCIALALTMSLALDGYQAGSETDPHYFEGRLLLRVHDVTTLISVALVMIKSVVGSWSTAILWASGRYMLFRSAHPESPTAVSFMLRRKLPPWLRLSGGKSQMPKDVFGWASSLAILSALVQTSTGPLLTGSVEWNPTTSISNTSVAIRSVDPATTPDDWRLYNSEGGLNDKRGHLRLAAGHANLAWAETSLMDAKGNSNVGNGCRHIVHYNGLPRGSVVEDMILPCINIRGIQWYHSADQIAPEDWADVESKDLSLVGDDPFSYSFPGVSAVYEWPRLRSALPTDTVPLAHLFSGTKTVALLAGRHDLTNQTDSPCKNVGSTIFGNLDALPYHLQSRRVGGTEECFLIGKLNFTAGMTRSRRARFIAPRVIEDLTPVQEVRFEASPWVPEALWLLPDVMTMISIMNTSQIPTFNNIDGYVDSLTRQAFLGAWDMLSHSFDEGETRATYSAFPAHPRLVANINNRRVFSWLAICGLMSVTGILVLTTSLENGDLAMPREDLENDASVGVQGVQEVATVALQGHR